MNPGPDPLERLYANRSRTWLMSHAERAALLQVLAVAQPEAAMEIGTCHGGCLEQIRRHAKFTYSIDLDPEVASGLAPAMPDVEFLTGDSREMIGVALSRCAERGQALGFALIDGDHRFAGVQADIHALLAYRPSRPLWVLLHDSGNPECRAGIAAAHWASNPHVHRVELDFVTGTLSESPQFEGMIWGGLALALLLPEPRQGDLVISASAAKTQAALYRASEHYPGIANRWRRWYRIKRKGWNRRRAAIFNHE